MVMMTWNKNASIISAALLWYHYFDVYHIGDKIKRFAIGSLIGIHKLQLVYSEVFCFAILVAF